MCAIESQGTLLEIGTGTGGAKTITDIILGAITEVTSAAHGLSVGDVVTFAAIVGTTELNGVSAMVIAKETNALFFNIDSSGYTPYVSGGTATPVTWSELGEVVDWDGPGGQASVIDKTHLRSAAKEKMIGLKDEGQFNLSVNWEPSDTGQAACKTARTTRTAKDFRITYSDATVHTFSAYVMGFPSSGGVDDKVNGSITLEIDGAVTES